MRRLRSFCLTVWRVLPIVMVWLAMYGEVLAKGKKEGTTSVLKSGSNTPWVMPYILTLLGIGLGMLVVCRSSRRGDRAKPEQYESLHGK